MSLKPPSLSSHLFAVLLSALLVSCAGQEATSLDGDRHPLGKADSVGSCVDSCGGQSDGSCWCDSECSFYGDCCGDKVETCNAPSAKACGDSNGPCADDEYCQVGDGQGCGGVGSAGVCVKMPSACVPSDIGVCACNGEVFASRCEANRAGFSLKNVGDCEPAPPICGGIGNLQCEAGLVCSPDPSIPCGSGTPDCSGICLPAPPPICGGIGNLQCEAGLVCSPDPSIPCGSGTPDCSGICLAP